MNVVCTKYNESYQLSDDHLYCTEKIQSPCLKDVIGCLECIAPGSSICTKCDSENHYELKDGQCSCMGEYAYNDNISK